MPNVVEQGYFSLILGIELCQPEKEEFDIFDSSEL